MWSFCTAVPSSCFDMSAASCDEPIVVAPVHRIECCSPPPCFFFLTWRIRFILVVFESTLGLLFESLSAGKLQSNSFTAAAHVERYVGKAQHELCSSWPMFSEAHKLLAIVC